MFLIKICHDCQDSLGKNKYHKKILVSVLKIYNLDVIKSSYTLHLLSWLYCIIIKWLDINLNGICRY